MTSAAKLLPSAARREVSQSAAVWWMTGGFLWLMAAVVALGSAIGYSDDRSTLLVLAAVLAGSGGFFFVRPAAPAGSPASHVALVLIWGNTAAGVAAISPDGSIAMGAALFIGPVTAMRCLDRSSAALHVLGATVAFALAGSLAELTPAGRAVVFAALPAMWFSTVATVLVLEAIDAQADALTALVRRDALTGLGNRRMLDEALEREIARHTRAGHSCSIVALDLDGFKALNDRAGHPAGDAVLAAIGPALGDLLRTQDVAVRQGGDEFLIVLPETDEAGARRVALVVRERLIELGRPHGVGVSIGQATFPQDGEDAATLLDVADARVRAAKGTRDHISQAPGAEGRAPRVDRNVATDAERARRIARRPRQQVTPFNREQLAVEPRYWWPFGAMRIGAALLTAACALGPADEHQTASLVLAAALLIVGIVTLAGSPPARGSAWSHASMAFMWGAAVIGAVVMQPAGGAAVALGMAVGPYLAVRITSVRGRLPHLAAAAAAIALAVALGAVDRATTLLLLLMLAAWAAVSAASAIVFLAAEDQATSLERLMHRDPLTGAGNRRMLDERLEQELSLHRRTGESLAVFLLDLDGFKAINDELGHAAGDAVLRAIANGLSEVVRASDLVARHGGDEFCVVAPGATPAVATDLAAQLAERVRAAAPEGRPVSTSVGWATFPHDGGSADRLLTAADNRLLAAKARRPELDWR